MAGKFDAIFNEPRSASAPEATPPGRTEKPAPAPAPVRATAGRPGGKGKASNPEWDQTTVYLRRSTKQAAKTLLLNQTGGQDLSEVLEQLGCVHEFWPRVLMNVGSPSGV